MTLSPRPLAGALGALGAVAIAGLTLIAFPAPVDARCVEPAPIEEAVRTADVVIVGTVTAVAEEGTRATVRVEEIWRGPALEAEVVVWGGPGGRTSVDRTFEADIRYLFTITTGENGRLTDSLCSSTAIWDPRLEALRPAGMHLPVPAGQLDAAAVPDAPFEPASLLVPAAVALLVAIVLLVAGLMTRGREANR